MTVQEPNHILPSLWSVTDAPADAVDELVYVSNLLGSDPRITNFGGGNTSSKVDSIDPLTGETEEVLWVKASGGDLGSTKRTGFASLYQRKVLGLEDRFVKMQMHEDDIVPLYPQCVFNLNLAAPSIDTPLHAFVPFRAVSHMHSDAVIAIAASADADLLCQEIWGESMGILPWKRPGFELGLMLRDLIRDNPNIQGALMKSHGFICWTNDWRSCYDLTIHRINQAADFLHRRKTSVHAFGEIVTKPAEDARHQWIDLLPSLRGRVSYKDQRLIAKIDTSDAVLDFLSRSKSLALIDLGTSCPDHFLRTKIRPMVLPAGASNETLDQSLSEFRANYAAYYDRCKKADSPAMRNPNPSVVLIPGMGMVSFGKTAAEARITGEFYRNAIAVMEGAETVSRYIALPEQEAFNIEYWQLEEAKLKRQPPEKELSRQVALLIGAGQGIGVATAEALLSQGACVVVADVNADLVENTVQSLQQSFGKDNVLGVAVDVTDRNSVRHALEEAILHYGGIDIVVSLAAIFIPPGVGDFDDAWHRMYDVNLFGSLTIAQEANRVMQQQGTPGSIVLTSSANAVVAKKGSLAYDTAKAALNHLVRELAVEFAPRVRINAVAPATVVAGSQQFPRDRVLSSLQKYAVEFDESESTESLRDKLAGFYAKRTLLNQAVTPAKVAHAAFLLASDRLSQTTGQILAVDAGLTEAFLR
jgi:rhamnulose-1-phosphate aldolase/alcohol dehydrogenase